MADGGHASGLVVVEFPDEIAYGNAGDVAARLRAALAPGVSVVVADLTTTVFCDSSGVRVMLVARDWASADNVQLRLAVPPGPTLVVLKLLALDKSGRPDAGEALFRSWTPGSEQLMGAQMRSHRVA